MEYVAIGAAVAAVPARGFAAWSRFSAVGRRQLDQMAGIPPQVS